MKQCEGEVTPHPHIVFRAFKLLAFKDVKVVILGQDPYPQSGVADGLAFSVQNGQTIPKTLYNIFKELKDDIGVEPPSDKQGSLITWAKNGILLLNTSLTCETDKRSSHIGLGWEALTYEVVTTLARRNPRCVFILWGKYAASYANAVAFHREGDYSRILVSSHPSPLSVNSYHKNVNLKPFFGSRPFSNACSLLDEPYSMWKLSD